MRKARNKQLKNIRMQMHNLTTKNIEERKTFVDESEVKYSVDKELLLKAWKRYRLKDIGESSDEEEYLPEIDSKGGKLAKNARFRSFVGEKIRKAIIKSLNKTRNEEDYQELETASNLNSKNKILVTEDDAEEGSSESSVANMFISRFLLITDSNSNGEINLMHALRALPKRLTLNNFSRVEMTNQSVVQMSIIAFQNDDKDELFNFYDKRNKTRMQKIRNFSAENTTEIIGVLNRIQGAVESFIYILGLEGDYVYQQNKSMESIDGYRSESASDFT